MSEKMFNTRIQHKHDIEANWKKATGFIPKDGELVIYDADENCSYTRTKIGDGVTNVNDLAFIKASGYVAQEEAPYDTSVFWLDVGETQEDDSMVTKNYVDSELEKKVNKNQGKENIGKILVVGSDGNLILTEMPDREAVSDIVGTLDENNNIILMGALPNGTYLFKYEMSDGSIAEIGSVVVETIIPSPSPNYTNILTVYETNLNMRWSASGAAYKPIAGFISLEIPFKDIANKTIRMKGFTKGFTTQDAKDTWYFYLADRVNYGEFANPTTSHRVSVWLTTDLVDEGNGIYSIAINENTVTYFDRIDTLVVSIPILDREVVEDDFKNFIITIDELIT